MGPHNSRRGYLFLVTLIRSWVRSELFFLFFSRSHIHWPIGNFFGTLGMPPIEAPLWTPTCKIKINVHPWILVYIQGSWTLCKPYGIKPRCYREQLGEHIWELENPWETHWEHMGNMKKEKKIPNVFQNHCVPDLFPISQSVPQSTSICPITFVQR
jgi:hypothetical protein